MSDHSITDYDIQALVDNELDWETQKRVQEHLRHNPRAQKRYQELSEQKALLKKWWESDGGKMH